MRYFSLLSALCGAALVTGACGESFKSSAGNDNPGGGGDGQGGDTGQGGDDPTCVDDDQDGVTDCDGDCDETDPTTYPGAPEICGDGVDNACGENPDPEDTCLGIGTFVSAAIGDDSNPGTTAEPLRTIKAGMTNAATLGMMQPVFVAEGQYDEDITLVEGVDLWGGYSCVDKTDCSWTRDWTTYISTIGCQDNDGIVAGDEITAETTIDGFTVIGHSGNPGNGNHLSAFFIQGTPRIINNHVSGGDAQGCTSCSTRAIVVTGLPSAVERTLIEGNVIEGGSSGVSVSNGIEVSNGGTADILANEITGGDGTWSHAITLSANAGQVSVIENDVHAGSCGSSTGTGTTGAIRIGHSIAPLIDRNRINADSNLVGSCSSYAGNWWNTGIESEGSAAIVTNNVIYGVPAPRSAAVLLADCEGTCQPSQVELINNTLDGSGVTSSVSAAVVFKTFKQGQNIQVGKVANNILLGGVSATSYGGLEDVSTATGVGVGGSTAEPKTFDNNDIWGATVLYRAWDGTQDQLFLDIAAVNSGVNGANENISADPALDATLHLTAGSPCIDKGTSSGNPPTWDIDGDGRPQGVEVDIGADEAR